MEEGEYAIRTQQFEGPLELLLSLIQDRKLYINEISLAEVTDGYLQYVLKMATLPLKETAHFVLISATLLLIKSRSLLPSMEITSEEERSIQELTDRLAHYQKIREGVRFLLKWMKQTPSLYLQLKRPISPRIVFDPGETTKELLRETLSELVRSLPSQIFHDQAVVKPLPTLHEVLESMGKRIAGEMRISFKNISAQKDKNMIILHFLALLELVKANQVSAEQQNLFDDIILEPHTVGVPHY